MYGGECLRVDRGVAAPADVMQAMLDVGPRFAGAQRAEVARGGDALAKLFHRTRAKHLPQLRLSDQKTLKQRMMPKLKIGQHSELFDFLESQVLGLVDDEQRTPSARRQSNEERFERREHLGFRGPSDRNANTPAVRNTASDSPCFGQGISYR